MKRLLLVLSVVIMVLGSWQVSYAEEYEFVNYQCFSTQYEQPVIREFLLVDGEIFISEETLLAFSGFESSGSPLIYTTGSGGMEVVYRGRSYALNNKIWVKMDTGCDLVYMKTAENDGSLFFYALLPDVQKVKSALAYFSRYQVNLDTDDWAVKIGSTLAAFYHTLTTMELQDYVPGHCTKEQYETAIYELLQPEELDDRIQISDLAITFEEGIYQPVADWFSMMDRFFPEDVLDAFYAGSDLATMKEFVDGYDQLSAFMAMKPSELYRHLEYTLFAKGYSDASLKGLEYMVLQKGQDGEERQILSAASEIADKTDLTGIDQLMDVYADVIGIAVENGTTNFLMNLIHGKNAAIVRTTDRVMKTVFSGVNAMEPLQRMVAFSNIQKIVRRGLESALVRENYLQAKYLGYLYLRCTVLAGDQAKRVANDAQTVEGTNTLMETCMTKQLALLAVSDAELICLSKNNPAIHSGSLTAMMEEETDLSRITAFDPNHAYAQNPKINTPEGALYQSLVNTYGELDLVSYNGITYIEEGSGIITPWYADLCGQKIVAVLRQEGSSLIQDVYLKERESDTYTRIASDYVLTAGMNGSRFMPFGDSPTILLSCSVTGSRVIAYEVMYTMGYAYFDPSSGDSVAELQQGAWDAFNNTFGSPIPIFTVDGSNGLFQIDQEPAALRQQFWNKIG